MWVWDRVRTRLETEGALVAGVLSGTSADGIDVALARLVVQGRELALPELLHFETLALEPRLHARLRAVLDGAPCGLAESALLHRDLGWAFGRAAKDCAERAGLVLDLVGSHGQTVWHHDGDPSTGRASTQWGDGDHVAQAAGVGVACDFRQADLAAGGEGAPLSGLADGVLFQKLPRPAAILNLGGIANLTLLCRDERVLAWDTGPANSMLDGLARSLLGQAFDADGACAAQGRVHPRVLERWLEHPYFSAPRPKSTGRDTFGAAWVQACVQQAQALGCHSAPDLCATAVEFLSVSIAREWASLAAADRPAELLVAGGGVHHRLWMQRLELHCGVRVLPASQRGVHPDAREGLVFAILAARCVLGWPSTRPESTGARAGRVLGKLCWPGV
jgi:anhydro-N-acetylmuramic acid kinase